MDINKVNINQQILKILKTDYDIKEINHIQSLLDKNKVFEFTCLTNGLFPASASDEATETGYTNIWIRDNIYIAYAKFISGETDIALKNIRTLLEYFKKHRFRFERVIDAQVKPISSMERPHIRFNGLELVELKEPWEHAQNDALGYFLWLFCKLHANKIAIDEISLILDSIETLTLFPLYFQVIRYWEDEDSGHWEEEPKVEASSIGVVIAGLKELKKLMLTLSLPADSWRYKEKIVNLDLLDNLIDYGYSAINRILPYECIQIKPKYRRYDGALLFLVYPLDVIAEDMASRLVNDIILNLKGDYGIRRYMGDDFWCHDFQKLPQNIQCSKHTDRQEWLRGHSFKTEFGKEAQWCIFDPIISAYYGSKYQSASGNIDDLHKQTHFFNRSLMQVTGPENTIEKISDNGIFETIKIPEFKCPELYYLQNNRYSPNTSTPLSWTQANLLIAIVSIKKSLEFKRTE
jgi:GH15 family glucan-1,4-alpha-glucosidase